MPLNILLVAVGGAFGSVMRYLTGVWAGRLIGLKFPYGTLTVNVLGGLLMGILIGTLALRGGENQERWRIFIGIGVLGGYTTFSSFSLEAVMLIERRDYVTAAGYVLGSVILSIAGLFAGLALMRHLA